MCSINCDSRELYEMQACVIAPAGFPVSVKVFLRVCVCVCVCVCGLERQRHSETVRNYICYSFFV